MAKRGVQTLKQFYNLIYKTRNIRRRILKNLLKGKGIKKKDLVFLKKALTQLKRVEKEKGSYVFSVGKDKIYSNLEYEIEELKRDILYLEKGEAELLKYLSKKQKGFNKEVEKVCTYLKNKNMQTFITDRDGTINNYCEHYDSSVQSVYNAFFLMMFAEVVDVAIIITSGPLRGILNVAITPKSKIIYSGSKGREFVYKSKKFNYKLEARKNKVLQKVAKAIKNLSRQERYRKFFFKGSGFQQKLGEISIARQDFLHSVPKKESQVFFRKIQEIVRTLDKRDYLKVYDAGLDIEVILKLSKKEFTKGDGLKFILQNSKIKPKETLVCGDTDSDLSFFKTIKKYYKKSSYIFVTKDNSLKRKIKKTLPKTIFISSPDVLITALYKISKLKNGI